MGPRSYLIKQQGIGTFPLSYSRGRRATKLYYAVSLQQTFVNDSVEYFLFSTVLPLASGSSILFFGTSSFYLLIVKILFSLFWTMMLGQIDRYICVLEDP